MGDVGAVVSLLDGVARWFMSEDGYAQWRRRRELERLREDALAALKADDFPRLERVVRDLERLSKRA